MGFVYVAWDGDQHGFILDTAVLPEYRRRGIGTELVRRAAAFAAQAGLEVAARGLRAAPRRLLLPRLRLRPTPAGLLRLGSPPADGG